MPLGLTSCMAALSLLRGRGYKGEKGGLRLLQMSSLYREENGTLPSGSILQFYIVHFTSGFLIFLACRFLPQRSSSWSYAQYEDYSVICPLSHLETLFQPSLGDGEIGNPSISNCTANVTSIQLLSLWWAPISVHKWIHFYLYCFNYWLGLLWLLFHLFLSISVLNFSACKLPSCTRSCTHLAYSICFWCPNSMQRK